jgi:hypothetical protein
MKTLIFTETGFHVMQGSVSGALLSVIITFLVENGGKAVNFSVGIGFSHSD